MKAISFVFLLIVSASAFALCEEVSTCVTRATSDCSIKVTEGEASYSISLEGLRTLRCRELVSEETEREFEYYGWYDGWFNEYTREYEYRNRRYRYFKRSDFFRRAKISRTQISDPSQIFSANLDLYNSCVRELERLERSTCL